MTMYYGHPAFESEFSHGKTVVQMVNANHDEVNTHQWTHWVNELYDCENRHRARCIMQMIYILSHVNENDYWWWNV